MGLAVGVLASKFLLSSSSKAQKSVDAEPTAKGKRVAVVLAGCGVNDGAEITEAVSTLVHCSAVGASTDCFAPDMDQFHVIDHAKGKVSEGEKRNVMVEAARISRGKISPLASLKVDDYDAILIPGGFGAAKNLCNHATVAQGDGSKMVVVSLRDMRLCECFLHIFKVGSFICEGD